MSARRSSVLAVLVGAGLLTFPAQIASASPGQVVECGSFEYVAPDLVNPGSIVFGANSSVGLSGDAAYGVAPGASTPPNLDQLSGAPSCLAMTLDAGVVTAVQYAPTGTVRGRVVVHGDLVNDPQNAFFVTAGRVVTPAVVLYEAPGIRAVLGNAVATGKDVKLVLEVDTEYGYPRAFTAATNLRGAVVVEGGDVHVGAGTLPGEVIDAADLEVFEQMADDGASAKVRVTSTGTIDLSDGALNVSTDLEIRGIANDVVAGSVEGPCGVHAYYGVFDNTSGTRVVAFRLTWVTLDGTHLAVKSVPKGHTYTSRAHWAKPGTYVRVSYWNTRQKRWTALSAQLAQRGSHPACDYEPGFATSG